METSELRQAIHDGAFAFVPSALSGMDSAKGLFARLDVALGLAAELDGGTGARSREVLAGAVMEAGRDPRAILRVLRASEFVTRVERRTKDPAWLPLRALYGLPAAYPSARIAACLAADATWMPYAHGMLLAQRRAPATLGLDVRMLTSTLYLWAIQDYPAIALALGAALATEPPLPFRALADFLPVLVKPHIGGSFAEQWQVDAVRASAERTAAAFAALLLSPKTPPFTTEGVAGLIIDDLAQALPGILGVDAPDPVSDFEAAAAELVFKTVADGGDPLATMSALERLNEGLRRHVA